MFERKINKTYHNFYFNHYRRHWHASKYKRKVFAQDAIDLAVIVMSFSFTHTHLERSITKLVCRSQFKLNEFAQDASKKKLKSILYLSVEVNQVPGDNFVFADNFHMILFDVVVLTVSVCVQN